MGIHGGSDELYWSDNVDGQYTSKGGYNFMRMLLSYDAPSSSTSAPLRPAFWKKFWATQALPRCKETSWRAISGYLPLKERLFRPRVDVDPGCSFCATHWETEDHFFLQCPATRQIWFASPGAIRADSFSCFRDFWAVVALQGDGDFLALVQATVYAIWEARNQVNFQQRPLMVHSVLSRVESLLAEVSVRDNGGEATVAAPARWKRPAQGTIKCNFDASFKEGDVSRLGMIARDHEGAIMATACSFQFHTISSLLAEPMSMRWTMQLAIDLGFRRICVETDCVYLFRSWHATGEGRSYLSSILRDCRLLLSGFDHFTVSFVRRTGNVVADFLAKNVKTYANQVWVEEVPAPVLPLVISDIT
ncbi:uncharacterized protein LOC130736693 [Lotus japonicus]|uniref:uncharacterized protein LOC130736693 n=1 Tax=Lotus japonicus TaxID=34305 RepID=UPI00258FA58C|nr:uncharacterized protein LOC130736693 [Lotus japonicus]